MVSLHEKLHHIFDDVVCCKPRSSRNSSFEAFIVCRKLKVSHATDINHAFEKKLFSTNFLASGSLSHPDSDKSHILPEGHRFIGPIEMPTTPPYKTALLRKYK